MGVRVGGDTAVLDFGEGTTIPGAEVRVSLEMQVGPFMALMRRVVALKGDDGGLSPDDIDAMESTFREFATDALVSWNLTTQEDVPIPADVAGFSTLPYRTAMEIINAWMKGVSGASPNSRTASANGNTSGAEDELMGL